MGVTFLLLLFIHYYYYNYVQNKILFQMVSLFVVLWLWFTRYVGGRPKIRLFFKLLAE